MNIIQLPAVALVISILLFIIFFSKKHLKNTETTIYRYMLIINFIFSTLAVVIVFMALFGVSNEYIGTLQKIYLSFMIMLIFLILIYNLSICKFKNKKLSKTLFIVNLLVILSILLTNLTVINTNEVLDGYGMSYDIAITITVVYFLIITITSIIIFFKNKKEFSKDIPFVILIFFFLGGLIIRNYFPQLIFETFFFSFMLLIMYHTIENPDLKLLREIQESKELAEQSNKEKAMFLYDVAQDIKLPIKSISNKCDELIGENDLNTVIEGIRDIKFSTKKLSSGIDSKLDVSGEKNVNIEIAHNKYNIKNLLQEVSIKAKSDLKDKNIEFRSDFDVNIPEYLYGDSIRLKQILTIIIENAIKHTEKGFIEFNTSSIIKNDVCRLMINIEDSGKGIESRKLETLFYLSEEDLEDQEKMNKLASTKENLSVIKLLTTLIGGTVIVNSTLGKGTKFTIVLDQEIHADEKSSTIEAIDTLKTMKRVLLVNNLDIDIKALSKILEKYDVSFDVVKWGQECLEKIRRKEKYDYILLDEEMPKLNGIKTFEKLKLENNFDIPVILLVEEEHEKYKERYLNNGFTDVIAKPYKKVAVTKVLDKYLK